MRPVGSRVLARRFSVVQQEEAFLAGLLANMGVLALHRVMPQEFDALFAQAKGDDVPLHALCREKFDLTPPEVAVCWRRSGSCRRCWCSRSPAVGRRRRRKRRSSRWRMRWRRGW